MTKNFLAKTKTFDWAYVQNLGILGFLGMFWIPELRFFFLLYLFFYVTWFKGAKDAEKELKGKSLSKYYLTFFLSQINPFTLFLSFHQLLGQAYILIKNPKGLPNKNNYQSPVEYDLPFREEWLVAGGGSTKENSHSWDILTQRYAYDFVICDSTKATHKNLGKELTDYYCFNLEVLSPADGTVIKVNDHIPDYTGVGDYSIDWRTKDFRGNFTIIKHAEKEYSFIAHFKRGSIMVKEGEEVKRKQPIGRCGNSGHSAEPHIHFHLQDSKSFWRATGLPIRFKKVSAKINGNTSIRENAFIEKKERVQNID